MLLALFAVNILAVGFVCCWHYLMLTLFAVDILCLLTLFAVDLFEEDEEDEEGRRKQGRSVL